MHLYQPSGPQRPDLPDIVRAARAAFARSMLTSLRLAWHWRIASRQNKKPNDF